ncbi:MAG: 2-phospho-L-lactate transferase [Deltaproteobacteria bacterium]|nr:2-phospho-L-lactate transferase [Deltaproteobacteria bacterium]
MITVLTGGVGGAKLLSGLAQLVPHEHITAIINTADDLELHSLYICPDIDTTIYTLAGISNPVTGWGVKEETFNVLNMLEKFGRETWFKLGDKDIATHLFRKELLESGESLTEVTKKIASALGVKVRLLPMSDDPVHTIIETPEGELPFQDYFVRRGWQDKICGVRFNGAEDAKMSPQVEKAIRQADLIIICPSNPIVSISPILSLSGMKKLIKDSESVCVAVSPVVKGRAVSGPAGKLMEGVGLDVSALGVAQFYSEFVDGFVIDKADRAEELLIKSLGIKVLVTNIIMSNWEQKIALAKEVLDFSKDCQKSDPLCQ